MPEEATVTTPTEPSSEATPTSSEPVPKPDLSIPEVPDTPAVQTPKISPAGIKHDEASSDGIDYASSFENLHDDVEAAKEEPAAPVVKAESESKPAEAETVPPVSEAEPLKPAPEPEPVVAEVEPKAAEPAPPADEVPKPAEVITETEGKTVDEVEAETKTAQENIHEMLESAAKNRNKIIDTLASDHYGKVFSDEFWEELNEKPREVMARVSATIYTDAVQGVTAAVLGQLPGLIGMVLDTNANDAKAESSFFNAFPMLADAKFAADIKTASDMYVGLNPKATLVERIQNVGVSVCLKHKVIPPGVSEAPAVPVVPAAPAAPVVGGSTDFGSPVPSGNAFEMLADELVESGT